MSEIFLWSFSLSLSVNSLLRLNLTSFGSIVETNGHSSAECINLLCDDFESMECARPFLKLGPAYNEFGYNEHPSTMSRFLCIKIIDCNIKKFGYNEHPLIMSSFLCIILNVVNGTRCNLHWCNGRTENRAAHLVVENNLKRIKHNYNGSFTMSKIETDRNTNKTCSESNGNLHQSPSLSSINTSTQFHRSHFSSVLVSVSAGINTP